MSRQAPPQGEDGPRPAAPTFWQTVGSVAASFFGVQSARNRQRDFTHGRAWHYVVIGVVMTVVLVGALVLLVRLLLRQAGMP